MKSFQELINEDKELDLIPSFKENLTEGITAEEELLVEQAYQRFIESEMTLEQLEHELTNEGIFGSLLGGLTGFALGKSVGKMIAKALGIKSGVFYDLLTSRLVGAALGSSMGKKFF